MRVSPIAWAYHSLDEVLQKAKESAEVTHNHPEGIKGAQATAASIFLMRKGISRIELKSYIEGQFQYNLDLNYQDLIKTYQFNETCQETVPQAIYTFLISNDFEDSIRKAICIGGDSDTLACINGSLAEAVYSVPAEIKEEVYKRLDGHLSGIVKKFH